MLFLRRTYHYQFVQSREKRDFLQSREIVDEDSLLQAYDYVIAGGGLAGLVLAARLSQSNTVLVLEAGLSGDAVANGISEFFSTLDAPDHLLTLSDVL